MDYVTTLFNYTGYTASTGGMISNDRLERIKKRMWPILKYYPSTWMERLRKVTKLFSQDKRCSQAEIQFGTSRIRSRGLNRDVRIFGDEGRTSDL